MNAPMAKTCYNLLFRNYPQYEVLRQELLKLFYRKALNTGGKVDCYVNVNAYIRSIYRRKDYAFERDIKASFYDFSFNNISYFTIYNKYGAICNTCILFDSIYLYGY